THGPAPRRVRSAQHPAIRVSRAARAAARDRRAAAAAQRARRTDCGTLSDVRAPDAPTVHRHSRVEDTLAFLSAAILAALGIALFERGGLMTGGTAGLALLVSYRFGLGFGPAFVLVNLPFFALALWRMGWRFTAKTAAAVVLLSAVTEFQRPL